MTRPAARGARVTSYLPLPPAGVRKEFDDALRTARLAEAARLDAIAGIRDAQSLRLATLRDELRPLVAAEPRLVPFVQLALMTEDPPRLWIDLVTSVAMEPDTRLYRLELDYPTGRVIALETGDRDEMRRRIVAVLAHRVIERERAALGTIPVADSRRDRHSTAALILAWLAGFSLGVLALLTLGVWLSKSLI